MWQRNECGLTKLPSAAFSYSRATPAPRTSGLSEATGEQEEVFGGGVKAFSAPAAGAFSAGRGCPESLFIPLRFPLSN